MPKRKMFDFLRLSLYPTPVVVVTSVDNAGNNAAATIAWNGVVSSRPQMVGVSFLPDSFTRKCLLETREFVVNIPDGRQWKSVNFLGSISGPWDYKMKEYKKKFGSELNISSSSTIRSPYITDFPLHFECRLMQVIQVGLYDFCIGQVQAMQCEQSIFKDDHPRGNLNHTELQPLMCQGDEYWSAGKFLGYSTENKDHPHGRKH